MTTASNDTKVIQCPACQTKFAVKASQLAATSFPRFHCSRCDHVFGVEQQVEMELTPVADPMREESSPPIAVNAAQQEAAPEPEIDFPEPQPSSSWLLGDEKDIDTQQQEVASTPADPFTAAVPEPQADFESIPTQAQELREPEPFEQSGMSEQEPQQQTGFTSDPTPPVVEPEITTSVPPTMEMDPYGQTESEHAADVTPEPGPAEMESPYTIQEEPVQQAIEPTPLRAEKVEIPPLDEILNDTPIEETNQAEESMQAGAEIAENLGINKINSEATTEMPSSVRQEALEQMDMVLNPRAMRPSKTRVEAPIEEEVEEPELESLSSDEVSDTLDFSEQAVKKDSSIWSRKKKGGKTAAESQAPVVEELTPETFAGVQSQQVPSRARSMGRWKSVAAVSAPLILFLGLLLGVAFFMTQNPGEAWAVSSQISGNNVRVAPAGLLMSSIGHNIVELESGDTVHVIEGTLENNSDETFQAITLEAFIFNSGHKVLAQSIVSANSSLGRTRIQSLTLPMIENLQKTERNQRFKLKPGQEFDFTIALPEGIGETVDSYSARIYSVQ